MQLIEQTRSSWRSMAGMLSARDALARLTAFATVVLLGLALLFAKGTAILMPGPLTSAHSSVENCSSCHSQNGSGKLSWLHGLVAGSPLSDSKACLGCHKMPDTAFNPHGASDALLKQSTERSARIAAVTQAPPSALAQRAAFPTTGMVARGLTCATCHQEHQGTNFNLKKISNEQCRACHAVQFDSFDGDHPKFDSYPFKQRTRIVYDHAGHFGKHYPELAKGEKSKRIPEACTSCHDSSGDKRVMDVKPFEKSCAACHLDQITGTERATGPKGIAVLALPGLDLPALQAKRASIGEWPEASEAALTPFMKMMIGRREEGRALLRTVADLNLQDLSRASDAEITAVTALVWEIKALFSAMISGRMADALGDLNTGSGAKLSASLVADLTASIPRDVIIGAQRQWLPNLASELADRNAGREPSRGPGNTAATDAAANGDRLPASGEAQSAPAARSAAPAGKTGEANAVPDKPDARQAGKLDPPACLVSVLGQCLVFKDQDNAGKLPPPSKAGLKDIAQAGEQRRTDQSDELLFPSAEEQRELDARGIRGSNPAPSASGNAANPALPSTAAPELGIDSGVDPESWAESGGWYRQDYTIFYRPTGHKDRFVFSWLFLTGPQSPAGDKGPAAAVFDYLTGKGAQGSCTKCHSVDAIENRGRVVNFTPVAAADKEGRFTQFIHEPHLSLRDTRGCLTCHELAKDAPYLKTYEQRDPRAFASNFGAVTIDSCRSCHSGSKVRQDCGLCHKYHVNGVGAPTLRTQIPAE